MTDQQTSLCTLFRKFAERGDSRWLWSRVHRGKSHPLRPPFPFLLQSFPYSFSISPKLALTSFSFLLSLHLILFRWLCTNHLMQYPSTALTLSPEVEGQEWEAPLLSAHWPALMRRTSGSSPTVAYLLCKWPDSIQFQLCRPHGLS